MFPNFQINNPIINFRKIPPVAFGVVAVEGVERVLRRFDGDPSAVACVSWLACFGVLGLGFWVLGVRVSCLMVYG